MSLVPLLSERGEISSGPERLIEIRIQDLEEPRVDVGEEVFFGPLDAESVEARAVRGVQGLALDVRAPPCIIGGVGAPVQGAADDVIAALLVGVVVPSGLGDVDLATLGPLPIHGIFGQHPDGGPEPVT